MVCESSSQGDILRDIARSLVDLEMEAAKRGVEEALKASIPPRDIIKEGLGKGMELVGQKYEKNEFFLSELIFSSAIMNEGMALLEPHLGSDAPSALGRVVIGTVEGDLHDIGKNLVATMLTSAGYEVHDLGVDVSPKKFIEKVKELRPDLVCMSALLSVTMSTVEETVKALEEASVRRSVKVLVGGRCLNEQIAQRMGADAYGQDAWDALSKAKELLQK